MIENAHIVSRLRAGFTDHNYALQVMREAADRIEAMQTAGAAMARRLDQLEPLCPDVEAEDLATGTVLATSTDRTAVLQLDTYGDGWRHAINTHARVLVIAIPDQVEVVPR